jgi:hypothetical protein
MNTMPTSGQQEESGKMITTRFWKRIGALLGVVVLGSAVHAEDAQQAWFPTPEAAAQALIDAAVAEDVDALRLVLGPAAGELSSGDPVADRADREAFVEAAVAAAGIEQEDGVDDRATLVIGEDDWPFPIPLVREEPGWRFDTAVGLDEIYARRIGRNELHAIAVLEAYVQAQYDYQAEDRTGEGRQFAQKLRSGEGLHDGLYRPVAEGEPASPMGPLVAEAVAAGYGQQNTGEPAPYHGYYYRILKAQGPNAPGGAMSYVNDGHMTRGFTAIAFPAEYGNSGIMTFIVNQQGIVFENDLGEETGTLATAITEYDPDDTWDPAVE